VILDLFDVTVTADITIDSIEIQNQIQGPTEVFVNPGVTLTLENDDNNLPASECCPAGLPDHNVFNGHLILEHSLAFGGSRLVLENTHNIHGTSRHIIGWHSDCAIEIADGKTVTSDLAGSGGFIGGSLTIESPGSAVLVNEGGVRAYKPLVAADGFLVIDASVQIDDAAGAFWEVAGVDVSLEFNTEATDLEGDFIHTINLGAGTFVINEDISTCGAYIRNCCDGKFDIASGKVFEFITYEEGPKFCDPVHSGTGTATCDVNYRYIDADVGSIDDDCEDD
jgi:hypothetical protein